jgi:hypothetical protein
MDVIAEMRNIVLSSKANVQNDATPQTIKDISTFTQNLLYIFDSEKTAAYKIAIISEYLENIATILTKQNINPFRDYLLDIKLPQEQQQTCTAIQNLLMEYVDLQQLNPQLIVFWLQCPCDVRSLKRMGAFMLFLSKEQQDKVLNKDKSLLEDPFVQKIKSSFVDAS